MKALFLFVCSGRLTSSSLIQQLFLVFPGQNGFGDHIQYVLQLLFLFLSGCDGLDAQQFFLHFFAQKLISDDELQVRLDDDAHFL